MNDFLLIVGSACLALLWIETGLPFRIKRLIWGNQAHLHRLKPLDCAMCMAFWLAVAAVIFFETKMQNRIYIPGISSVLAVFLTKQLNR